MNFFDLNGFHFINHLAGHHPAVDKIMVFFAQYAFALYVVLFLLAWFTLPKSDSEKRHALILAGFSGVLALGCNFLISQFYYRPRPFVSLPQGTFTQLLPHSLDTSFPSDHTSGSFGFAAGSWKTASFRIKWSFTLVAILVAISRVYTGEHWPTDILASIVIGIVSSKIIWFINPLFRPLTNLGLRIFHYGQYSKDNSRISE